jgi:hypothetical protein
MNSSNLKNLVKTGLLKIEPYDKQEYEGLIRSGRARLQDAFNKDLTEESRFLLAYTHYTSRCEILTASLQEIEAF